MPKSMWAGSRIRKYAYYEPIEIYRIIQTRADGLSLKEVHTMRQSHGANQAGKKRDTLWYRLRRAFVNPFTAILLVLAVVSFITDVLLASNFSRNISTPLIISLMIFISGAIRLAQELRAKSASEKLRRFIHTKATVKRGGVLVEIAVEDIVVGDIVLLSAGDRIPADMRLVQTSDLFISQAAITGESEILEKHSRTHSHNEQIPLTRLQNLVFMGTTVISGKGEGVVLAVGKETLYGTVLGTESEDTSPFRKGAASIAWVMVRFMAVLVPVVFLAAGITKGSWLESFIFALSVAVGLTPEMLPMVITACLARGSLSMSNKRTIIKNIDAMQGFGSMDVLCMDKTGTLTNEKILLEYYMDVLGNESTEVLELAFLNSLYHTGIENPIDNAILECRTMPDKAQYYDRLIRECQKADEIPFDYDRKCVSTLVVREHGEALLVTKGDITAVLSRCRYVEHGGSILPIEQGDTQSVSAVVDEMLENGIKVIAVARKEMGTHRALSIAEECDMVLMGYLAFFDAPKQSAKESISALKQLHVQPKILTGDRVEIAHSICGRVGVGAQSILTGGELNALSDAELCKVVETTDVFAELTPAQKVRIVDTLRENGHTVGFLGDGMNDVPAICAADVGISVDTAVDTAKDAAQVVLLQKDLTVLEQGILEGRKTFVNMLKYIKITASSNFGNIFSIVCASVFLPFLPMTAIQLLLLNLLYDMLCVFLPWDHVDREELATPRGFSAHMLNKFMLYFGPISSVFDILTFSFLYFLLCPSFCGGVLFTQLSDPILKARYIALFQTGWFLESMWTQILILHMLRTPKTPFLQSKPATSFLLITLAGVIGFTVLTYLPFAGILGLTALPIWYFIFLLMTVALYLLLTTIVKRFYIRKYHELI